MKANPQSPDNTTHSVHLSSTKVFRSSPNLMSSSNLQENISNLYKDVNYEKLKLFQKVSKLSVVQLCTHSIKVYTEATSFYTKQNKKYTVNGGKNQITFLRLPLTQQHFHSIPHQFHIIFMKENKCVFQENWTQLLQHIITQSTLLIS